MRKIAVVTATRAEYGLLSCVIKELHKYENNEFKVHLIVTGTHLSEKYGNTINEIIKDGYSIEHQIQIPVDSENDLSISKNQAETLIKFTELFGNEKYEAVVLLGDRYETLAIAIAAGNTHTPIFHLCGGDTTEGAIDEWIRHSISKMGYLHFVTNKESEKRVIQLGEAPERVFNYGSTSIDNILNVATMSKLEVLSSIDMDECNYALCTYHPVTLEACDVESQIYQFLEVIKEFPQLEFIVTKSNADQGGARINEILDLEEKNISNLHVFTSLGIKRYLSLMKYSEFVIGNSSSGIIEAPAFKVPTINIGDRQKGRLQSDSIINCKSDVQSICDAIKIAYSAEFREKCKTIENPYGDGNAAVNIAKKCVEVVSEESINLKKKFYDMW